jgi:carbonic anhydrase/acetyltransferase-like protein (isoleucine patch superfamily)
MALIKPYRGVMPAFGDEVFLAENASIIGDVVIGDRSNVWYGTVIRGDVGKVIIGRDTNVQDLTCIHMTSDISDARIGDEVTIGHSVCIHGAIVEDGALVGMGSVLLDNCRIGEGAFVGAGSLVTSGTVIPPRMLAVGRPAKPIRPLTDAEAAQGRKSAIKYVGLARDHR